MGALVFVMSCPFQIEISEVKKIGEALKHATAAAAKKIANALLAQEWSSEQQAIAGRRLGRDEATITRWVRSIR